MANRKRDLCIRCGIADVDKANCNCNACVFSTYRLCFGCKHPRVGTSMQTSLQKTFGTGIDKRDYRET